MNANSSINKQREKIRAKVGCDQVWLWCSRNDKSENEYMTLVADRPMVKGEGLFHSAVGPLRGSYGHSAGSHKRRQVYTPLLQCDVCGKLGRYGRRIKNYSGWHWLVVPTLYLGNKYRAYYDDPIDIYMDSTAHMDCLCLSCLNKARAIETAQQSIRYFDSAVESMVMVIRSVGGAHSARLMNGWLERIKQRGLFMSLLGTEIGELRKMQQEAIAGTLDPKMANLRLKIYRETSARAKIMLDIYKLGTLKGLTFKQIAKSGLVSEGEILPANATSFEREIIPCPDQNDKNITREECLDYSGEPIHNAGCRTCPNFKSTRTKLLGD